MTHDDDMRRGEGLLGRGDANPVALCFDLLALQGDIAVAHAALSLGLPEPSALAAVRRLNARWRAIDGFIRDVSGSPSPALCIAVESFRAPQRRLVEASTFYQTGRNVTGELHDGLAAIATRLLLIEGALCYLQDRPIRDAARSEPHSTTLAVVLAANPSARESQ